MLKRLEIKNYAIIEDLVLDFLGGLNIITGDTGAGKSILLGAMALIMGKRANTAIISKHKDKCITRALFSDIPKTVQRILKNNEIDLTEDILIQREINRNGNSRAYINDTPVKLNTLQSIAFELLDIHQQFDQQHIAEKDHQFQLIDAYADNGKHFLEYQNVFSDYTNQQKELKGLQNQKADSLKENDFISFQLNELESAELIENEEIDIESKLSISNNLSDYKTNLQILSSTLSQDEGSLIQILRSASNNLEQLNHKTPDVNHYLERVNNSIEELIDLGRESDSLFESMEIGNDSIDGLTERLNSLNQLINKHRIKSTIELIALRESFTSRIQSFESIDDQIEELVLLIQKTSKSLGGLASILHDNRKGKGQIFDAAIMKTLTKMDMPLAKFKTDISVVDEFTAYGTDEIDFLFTANAGTDLKPIKNFASGGELSRLNLSIKSLVADKLNLPTMVFDEIDAGISGKVALMMSVLLKNIGKKHQVISITHSPQIASRGNHHLHVFKQNEGGKTATKMVVLDTNQRIRNIAVMLSSDPPSKSALKNAEELIEIQ